MEAATPLRSPSVRTLGERVAIDALLVDDPSAVRLVREREEIGEDAVRVVLDALGIGARVLDREQTAADAEFVRSEFEKASRDVEAAFEERARAVAELLAVKFDEAFAPESGHVNAAFARHFSDESAGAVQHRVKAAMEEVMTRSREELLRQFSSADGKNPLADFKAQSVATIRQMSQQQDTNLRAMHAKLTDLEVELKGLRAEKEKLEEVHAERERGTAKGRSFEEAVAAAVDEIAVVHGDDCAAVGDLPGTAGKRGDVVVAIEGGLGPSRGRIVFEAKDRRLSRNDALKELAGALAARDADFAVLVVPSDAEVPARMTALRELEGDKLIVVFDPEDPSSRLALRVGYALARSRVLLARGGEADFDAEAVRDTIGRALTAMDDVRRVKSQLTQATTGIEKAGGMLDEMVARVRGLLDEVDGQLAVAAEQPGEGA